MNNEIPRMMAIVSILTMIYLSKVKLPLIALLKYKANGMNSPAFLDRLPGNFQIGFGA
jgi:hypothetical protein